MRWSLFATVAAAAAAAAATQAVVALAAVAAVAAAVAAAVVAAAADPILHLPIEVVAQDGSVRAEALTVYRGDDLKRSLEAVAGRLEPHDQAQLRDMVRKEVFMLGATPAYKAFIAVYDLPAGGEGDPVAEAVAEIIAVARHCPDAHVMLVLIFAGDAANGGGSKGLAEELTREISSAVGGDGQAQVVVKLLTSPTADLAGIVQAVVPCGSVVAICVVPACQLLPQQDIVADEAPITARASVFLHFLRILWAWTGEYETSGGQALAVVPPHPHRGLLVLYLGGRGECTTLDWNGLFRQMRRPPTPRFPRNDFARVYESVRLQQRFLVVPPDQRPPLEPSSSPDRVGMPFLRSQVPFVVLVVLESSNDFTTMHTFKDIAMTLAAGLTELGLAARVEFCQTLVGSEPCFREDEQVIVLAAHNLQLYRDEEGGLAVLTHPHLLPRTAVLYNFEHVPLVEGNADLGKGGHGNSRNAAGTFVTSELILIYQHWEVWDYNRANVQALRPLGIAASLVPLGGPSSAQAVRHTTEDREQIDVLFIGTPTPYRVSVIEALREAGIEVMFPNHAAWAPFGREAELLAMDAKIVLNLLAFDDDGEWKATRLLPLLAAERFVVSEQSGQLADQNLFAPGLVFVRRRKERDDDGARGFVSRLVQTLEYYLDRDEERAEIARRGKQLAGLQRQALMLREPVDQLLKNRTAP